MSKVLNYVTLPKSAEIKQLSETEATLAKIRLLQYELERHAARLVPLLSDANLREVEETVNFLHTIADRTIEVDGPEVEVPEYLTVRDVSRLTGLVPQVVRRHCAKGTYAAEQVAGENSTWRIKSEQFMHFSNWGKFLRERAEEMNSSKRVADHLVELWNEDGPVDVGTK